MADTVTSNVIISGQRTKRVIVKLTGLSDATGESNVVKVDRSTLILPGMEVAPSRLDIASIRWNIQGFQYVKLAWDHTADDTIALLSANGYEDYERHGALRDPNNSGDTVTGAIGDILLTSVGAAAGATYDITLEVLLVP